MSEKVNILIADKIDLTHLKTLNIKYFDITIRYGMSDKDLLNYSHNKKFEVLLIKSRRHLDKVFLSRCNFDLIGTASKGLDHIDVVYAEKRNIKIINSKTGNTLSAAEHTFALILDSIKRTHYADKLVRNGNFTNWDYERRTLKGKKIGIIGTGKVGLHVAKFSKAFNMQVLANDIDSEVREQNKDLKYYDIKYLLKNSDIISLHIPMSEINRKFIGKESLDLMKRNAIFVNTSRGEVIDERALISKMKLNKSFFSALDVFQNEPNVDKDLFKLQNMILTNHVAGKTKEGEICIGCELMKQIATIYR